MAFDLDEHLRREHKQTPFSEYLREIVYGGNDGIVTTFAVVAGFAGAQTPDALSVPIITVLLFGVANLFADGLSMSVGSFLSLRADQEVYAHEKSRESHEIHHDPDNEFAETVEILERKKFSTTDAKTLATIFRKNPVYWTEFMMKDELEMTNPEKENPFSIALATFFSFIAFGSIPLFPYLLHIQHNVFPISLVCTAGALILLGSLRAVVARQSIIRGVFETLLLGGLSAGVAYLVGSFFRA